MKTSKDCLHYNNVIIYDEPIFKKTLDLEKGEIIKTEYGDFDNIVKIIVTNVNKVESGSIKVTGVYLMNNDPFEGYCLRNETEEVIGKYIGEI